MDVSHEDEDVRQYNEDINLRYKLSSDWMKMLQNESFNDVCIKLHDGEVFANKVVLSARSEYFAASLRWKESNKEKKDAKHEIIFENCCMKIMTLVIEYLYSGVLKVSDLDIMELLELRGQVRMLLPGDKINSIIEDNIITEERLPDLNILELLELREKLRTLLPAEEILVHDYMEGFLYDIIDQEDNNFKQLQQRQEFELVQEYKSVFLTNEEVLSLIKSDQVQDRQRLDKICELISDDYSEIITSFAQAMRASLVFHGVLKSVKELSVNGPSISLIPDDQLKTLISSTTDWLEVSKVVTVLRNHDHVFSQDRNIKTSALDIILANIRSKKVEILGFYMTKRQTKLLVKAMRSGVEKIKLAGVGLDVEHFLKYQGNGTCKQIDIYNLDFKEDHKELIAWCKQVNWTIRTEVTEGTRRYCRSKGIRLERSEK